MKKQSFIHPFLLSLATITCLLCATEEAAAWERTALSDCKSAAKNCKKTQDQCKNDNEKCKRNAQARDLASFESVLSPSAKAQFVRFSDAKKVQAMNYADHARMPPDDAVDRVANGGCNCR